MLIIPNLQCSKCFCTLLSEVGENGQISREVTLTPNPVIDEMTVTISGTDRFTSAGLMIYNVLGQMIINTTLKSEKTNISLNQLEKGCYLVKINIDNTILTKRIIVD